MPALLYFVLLSLLGMQCSPLQPYSEEYDDSEEVEPQRSLDGRYFQPLVVSNDSFVYYLKLGVESGQITQEEMDREIWRVKSSPKRRATVGQMRLRLNEIKFRFHSTKFTSNKRSIYLDGRVSNNQNGWLMGRDVKLVIHGFTMTSLLGRSLIGKVDWCSELLNLYAEKDYNAIYVDWTALSSNAGIHYAESAKGAVVTSEEVANFLRDLKKKGLISSYRQVHIIGFSLGAHVAGRTGYHLSKDGNDKLGRITGIDPAGPAFAYTYVSPSLDKVDLSYAHLRKENAEFVDIIHCNKGSILKGSFGSSKEYGHVEFMVNGGKTQPSCGYITDLKGCSHVRCPTFFTKSLKYSLKACRGKTTKSCSFYDLVCFAKAKSSSTGRCTPFGDKCPKNARGLYNYES